jgi:hypothetical protein
MNLSQYQMSLEESSITSLVRTAMNGLAYQLKKECRDIRIKGADYDYVERKMRFQFVDLADATQKTLTINIEISEETNWK